MMIFLAACNSSEVDSSGSSSSVSAAESNPSSSSGQTAGGIRYWVTGLSEALTYEQITSFAESTLPIETSLAGITFAFSNELQPVHYQADGQTSYTDEATGEELPIPHFSVMAFSKIEDSAVFGGGQAEIVDGSMLNADDKGQCLISKDLADSAKKSVGDKIKIQNSLDDNITGEYQIKGIYQIIGYEPQDTPYPSNDPNNSIYISVQDLGAFNGKTSGNCQWVLSNFLMRSKEDADLLLKELQGKGLSSSVQLLTDEEIAAAQQNMQSGNISDLTALSGQSLTDDSAVTADIFQQHDVTMVNIWATYCTPCINEMEDLGNLNREYQDAGKSFAIVGVLSDVVSKDEETAELALEIVEKTKADYLHVILDFEAYQQYMPQIYAVPTTLFVDKDGKVISSTSGSRKKEDWQKLIDPLLDGNPS